ncbi:2-succinyl-5-enolpyruvyl-6-hydroxy-3-cyclohexene-1-carboxylic-acid synthase [Nonlabens ulvanivorans]|uniref:2-succinyl-5-enolpyruvyl-6-hydroxy-3-cyclohexene-1-carboxylate synthase n=1 Tax=Nonlabens ulvanivorans TaxID=906888 RepID=A0A084JW38_NONUL|nr:2-succinyl-5-enolpyruvyl-6-hydroxy-3-cyclohexene-1-carboxylic-acid synthase [Nonlabens ulvanivorans]KEZ93172.1 2-succinyl-5-enolpyruvyl-6-hydroxy-3-cyclohexene-1-carboxylate synthase [Nonlabens ulvanivorans]PRX13707.1 2-succinyl-5-enolpyruvyl-6-hydroxy-3-cyclohexene-1-carboxylate synthase [Nonlabens ulvanivorans]
MLSDILHAQQVLLLFKKRAVQHIVISPGSRNAPLTISFTNDSYFKCYSIVDERCASHFAMGIAQQLKQPVAVVCTSGSALLNYYPAVTEAFYSEIPLIVLSADRPPHKIDIGDGQTIRQQHVYANHILYDTHLEMINSLDDQEAMATNERLINKAINVAITNHGPVHINIPFEEPLYNTVNVPKVDPKVVDPIIETNASIPSLFIDRWEKANRKLVILSTLNPDVFTQDQLNLITSDPTVLVISEVSSNIRHEKIIWGIDTLIAPIENDEDAIAHLQPDMVVTIGGMIVSKKIKQYLRRFETQYHYHIGNRRAYDTFFKLAGHIKTAPTHWVDQLSINETSDSYRDYWLQFFNNYLIKRTDYLAAIPWSDFRAFNLIFDSLPDDIVLQLGNSSTIRYAQLFPMNPTHTVFSNRGTSGIDGSTSTAIGAAVAQDKPTVCITGDLSFLYDSNALWNNYIPANFKIIVINNSGGGIFRILPGEKDNHTFDTYFETTHQLDASHLCKMYDINYHRVDGEDAFAKAYEKFLNDNSKPQLLEIFTPRLENDTVLLDYFKFLK